MTTQIEPDLVKQLAKLSDLDALRALFVGSEASFSFKPDLPWLEMYGQEELIADYPLLFAKYGTQFGGDGVTTFGIPDNRGRVDVGLDNMGGTSANRLTGQTGGVNGDQVGNTGGSETHALTVDQLPVHDHAKGTLATSGAGRHRHSVTFDPVNNQGNGSLGGGDSGNATAFTSYAEDHTHSITGSTAETGSNQAHNNVQPSIVKYRCVLAY